MKTLKLFLCFILLSSVVIAVPTNSKTTKKRTKKANITHKIDEMSIYRGDGLDMISNFYTSLLTVSPKVDVIFPSPTDEVAKRWKSIYIISDSKISLQQIKDNFPTYYGDYYFVSVILNKEEKHFAKFLTEELFPYVELNYPVIDMPESRTIIVQDYNAIKVLENLPAISNSAKNMIFAFNYTTAMPEIPNNLDKGLNILALGPLENLAPLSNVLQNSGLVYLDNFACAFLKNPKDILMEANLNYIFNRENREIVDDSVYQPKDEFYAGIEYSFPFWFNLKTKDGYNLVYIPQTLDITPPFMAWKPTESKLSIIYGSPATKIRIKGEYPFGGSFRTNFRLVDLPVDK